MRLNKIEKEKFERIFDKCPVVLETDYGDLMLAYWINQQSILGIKIYYRFESGVVAKEYYYCDLTEVYSGPLANINICIFDPVTNKLEVNQLGVNIINAIEYTPDDQEKKNCKLYHLLNKN